MSDEDRIKMRRAGSVKALVLVVWLSGTLYSDWNVYFNPDQMRHWVPEYIPEK